MEQTLKQRQRLKKNLGKVKPPLPIARQKPLSWFMVLLSKFKK